VFSVRFGLKSRFIHLLLELLGLRGLLLLFFEDFLSNPSVVSYVLTNVEKPSVDLMDNVSLSSRLGQVPQLLVRVSEVIQELDLLHGSHQVGEERGVLGPPLPLLLLAAFHIF